MGENCVRKMNKYCVSNPFECFYACSSSTASSLPWYVGGVFLAPKSIEHLLIICFYQLTVQQQVAMAQIQTSFQTTA